MNKILEEKLISYGYDPLDFKDLSKDLNAFLLSDYSNDLLKNSKTPEEVVHNYNETKVETIGTLILNAIKMKPRIIVMEDTEELKMR